MLISPNRIDTIVLHKLFGPIIFLATMYVMFACAINLGGILQLWVDTTSEAVFVTGISDLLGLLSCPDWLLNVLANGVGRGINITLTFVPVLATIFLSLGVLEQSGYMLRAAYIVDRLMRLIGLSGESFVPLIVGFGCNVPAILGSRSLGSHQERVLTTLMTPFMSCGARLAIYAIFVAAFFPIGGQNVIFSLYLIGVLAAVLTGFMLRTPNTTAKPMPLPNNFPKYQWPSLTKLLQHTWRRSYEFVTDTGKLIIILSVIINGLGLDFLASVGKFITPLFSPMGITLENWPATLALLTGMVSKEAVIGTLNSYYANESMLISGFGSATAAYAYLLFTLLYFPCISVVAAIAKELSYKWAVFSVVWSTGLAYLISSIFYQLAMMHSLGWIVGLCITLSLFLIAARLLVRPTEKPLPTVIEVQ